MNTDVQNVARLSSLVRPHILKMSPYKSARSEYTGTKGIFLDANENSFGSVIDGSFNRYPDPLQLEVKKRLAHLKGVEVEQIFLGNGSDEAIDLLFRGFCEPARDVILTCPPTYGMYKVSADLNQIFIWEEPLSADFQLDADRVIARLTDQVKLIFICSPNNPSGNSLDPIAIETIIKAAPGLVVIDEAYIDFAPEKTKLSWLKQYPNLVVLQTFSKAWGLANLRLGAAYAHPFVIEILNKIKPPYNVNGLTQQMACEALDQVEKQEQMVAQMLEGRRWLEQALPELEGIQEVFPSDANFLLVRMKAAERVYGLLLAEEIILRNRSQVQLCEDCLRITVGRPEENH
ncbi:MAG: histidinol-phosphate transaminase, partial [Bacteroidota bacterium]